MGTPHSGGGSGDGVFECNLPPALVFGLIFAVAAAARQIAHTWPCPAERCLFGRKTGFLFEKAALQTPREGGEPADTARAVATRRARPPGPPWSNGGSDHASSGAVGSAAVKSS